jgi:UDP-glucose 4-epimerase
MAKRVLITGITGFIGSEVAYQLEHRGYDVVGIDTKKPTHKIGSFIKHDLRKPLKTSALGSIDTIIHLAAHIGNAAYSRENPATMLTDNARIDLNVIDAARSLEVERYTYISSSLVYEQSKQFPFVEDAVTKIPPPVIPYSFEKLFGERLCLAYQQQFGIPYTICRIFNAYGVTSLKTTDTHNHVIAELIKKVFTTYPVPILGNGRQKRNFTHVRDLARGICLLTDTPKAINETCNLGSEDEYSILQILKLIWQLSGKKEKLAIKHTPLSGPDLNKNLPSSKKIYKMVGWKPQVTMESGLLERIALFQEKGI